jgi:hypothetical protein
MSSIIVAAIVVYVVVKRFIGEPLNLRDLVVPPLVLAGLGIHALTKTAPLTAAELGWIIGGAAIGLAFGALRATTVRLFTRDGGLWQRYTVWTVVVWLVSFAASAGLGYLAVRAGVRAEARPLTLSIGVSLLGELLVLGTRALTHSSREPAAISTGNR